MKMVSRTSCGLRPPPKSRGKTLGQLIDEKAALVAVCKRCKHRRLLLPSRLAATLGRHFLAIDLRPRLKCTQCRLRAPNLHEATR
jgi:hypothetical protein